MQITVRICIYFCIVYADKIVSVQKCPEDFEDNSPGDSVKKGDASAGGHLF